MRAEIVDGAEIIDIRGKIGRGGGFGRIALGYNFFGFYSKYSGIYQKKYYFGKPYISKMKFFRPTNPQTVPQQAWRAVFADGKNAWDILDAPTKEIYRKKGQRKKMSGYNYFQSEYLKSHRL